MFVALGSPAQENWIIAHKEKLNPSVYQGVGARSMLFQDD